MAAYVGLLKSMVSQAPMVEQSSYGYPPPSLMLASPVEAAAELDQSSESSVAAQSNSARMEVSQAPMVEESSYGYPPPSLMLASPEAAAELDQSYRSSVAAQSTAWMEDQLQVSQAPMEEQSSYGYPPPSLTASPELAAAELGQSYRSSVAAALQPSMARVDARAAELKYFTAQARDAHVRDAHYLQERVETFTQQIQASSRDANSGGAGGHLAPLAARFH